MKSNLCNLMDSSLQVGFAMAANSRSLGSALFLGRIEKEAKDESLEKEQPSPNKIFFKRSKSGKGFLECFESSEVFGYSVFNKMKTEKFKKSTSIGDGSWVVGGAKIGKNVTIGKNCLIEENCIIEDGAYIGDNVHIKVGSFIKAGVKVGSDVRIDAYTAINNNASSKSWICTPPGTLPAKTVQYEHFGDLTAYITTHCGVLVEWNKELCTFEYIKNYVLESKYNVRTSPFDNTCTFGQYSDTSDEEIYIQLYWLNEIETWYKNYELDKPIATR